MSAPGAGPVERTVLAWQRTGLAVLVLAVATLLLAARTGNPVVQVLAALSAVGTAVGCALGRPWRPSASPWRPLLSVAAGTVGLALTGALAAVVSAGAHLTR